MYPAVIDITASHIRFQLGSPRTRKAPNIRNREQLNMPRTTASI